MLSLWKTVWKFLKKLKLELPTRSNSSTPAYIPKANGNTNSKRYTYQFITALFIIAKMWIQPKCPTVDEWVKKMWYTHIYIHTGTWYSHRKTNDKCCYLQQRGWTWMMLSEVRHTKILRWAKSLYGKIWTNLWPTQYHMISFIFGN